MCGEKPLFELIVGVMKGSPPRVRGEAVAARVAMAKERITPACAGRSCVRYEGHGTAMDHPRVCGEKISHLQKCVNKEGSPPRVRGED